MSTWDAVLIELQKTITTPTYTTWVVPLSLESVENGVAKLLAPSQFHAEYAARTLTAELKAAFCVAFGQVVSVRIAHQDSLRDHDLHDHDLNSYKKNIHDHDQPRFSGESTVETIFPKRDHDHDRGLELRTYYVKAGQTYGAELYRKVSTDPLFEIANQDWGMEYKLLYRLAEQKGFDAAKTTIERIKNFTGVRNRGAYCTAALRALPNAKKRA